MIRYDAYLDYQRERRKLMEEIEYVEHEIQHLRSRAIYKAVKEKQFLDDTILLTLLDKKKDLENRIDDLTIKIEEIEQSILSVPEEFLKPILWMYYVEGLTMEKIGEFYGLTSKSIFNHIHAASLP